MGWRFPCCSCAWLCLGWCSCCRKPRGWLRPWCWAWGWVRGPGSGVSSGSEVAAPSSACAFGPASSCGLSGSSTVSLPLIFQPHSFGVGGRFLIRLRVRMQQGSDSFSPHVYFSPQHFEDSLSVLLLVVWPWARTSYCNLISAQSCFSLSWHSSIPAI